MGPRRCPKCSGRKHKDSTLCRACYLASIPPKQKRVRARVERTPSVWISGPPVCEPDLLPPDRPTIRYMVARAATIFQRPTSAIVGPSRRREDTGPRMAVYAVGRACGFSCGQIANVLARDHSSIIHGSRQAMVLAAYDANYRAALAELERQSGVRLPLPEPRGYRVAA